VRGRKWKNYGYKEHKKIRKKRRNPRRIKQEQKEKRV
jgi:hypothetical protein